MRFRILGVAAMVAAMVAATAMVTAQAGRPDIASFTACTSAGLTSEPLNEAQTGTIVTFTATSASCANPEYLFLVQAPGGAWVQARGYGGPQFVWNTAGLTPGTYGIDVWVRDHASGASYEALKVISYTLRTAIACARPGYTTDKASPQQVGSVITFTAFVDTFPGEGQVNCSQPSFEYWIESPGGPWILARPYGDPKFVWDTAGLTAGTYRIVVWVRQNGSTATYETLIDSTYTLQQAGACGSAGLTADHTSPQPAGTQLTFTASSLGCSQPMYEFWLQYEGGAWTLARPFGSSPTLPWNTNGYRPGTYKLVVWANQNGRPTSTFDAYAVMNFVLTGCASVSATPSPSSPQPMGTSVQVVAAGAGCSSPQYQFELLAPGSQTWRVVQAYSPLATYTWDTTQGSGGAYRFIVKARDASSGGAASNYGGSWDAYTSFAYTLTTQACTSVSAYTAPPGSGPAGTAVTVTGVAVACPSPLYQFERLAPGSQVWSVVQAYSPSATLNWSTVGSAPGTYQFIVKARDVTSAGSTGGANPNGAWDAYALVSFIVTTTPCMSVTASANPPNTAAAGTVVTITASAAGCPQPLYQFEMLAPGSQTWQVVRAYSPTATYFWDTTTVVKGTYRFIVKARDASSPGTSRNYASTWDSYVAFSYSVVWPIFP